MQSAINVCFSINVGALAFKGAYKNLLNQRFDKANFKDEFAQKIESLSKGLKSHRQNNFFGHILQHQTLQSTKYLSKWIEEKNR